MLASRPPGPALRPFVRRLWASEPGDAPVQPGMREHVLPAGTSHVAIRLGDVPVRVFRDADDRLGTIVGSAVLGGARSTFYVKDAAQPCAAVGVELEPAAAGLLFGVPADELAERHTPLEDLWGSAVAQLRERLAAAAGLVPRLEVWERFLAARLPRAHGIHPTVAHAVLRLSAAPEGATIGAIAAETGYSTRRLLTLFRAAVGLAPSTFARVRRFAAAVQLAADRPRTSWAGLALDAGYSDQPHLTREFRALAGVSPGRYRALAPPAPRHVPLSR